MGKLIIFQIFNLFCALGVLCDKGIIVENEPTFDDTTKFMEKLAIGDDLVFVCKIRNVGNYSISWMKDGKIIATGNDSVTPDRIEAIYFHDVEWYRLIIQDLRWEDAGNYTCQIKTNPPRQNLFTLELGDPKFVTANQTFRVTRGETFVLPCEIKDLGDWVPFWRKINLGENFSGWKIYKEPNAENTFTYGVDEQDIKFVDGFNLEIRNVSDEFSGIWICGFEETSRDVHHTLEVVDNNSLM